MTHPLTDEICDQITDELSIFSIEDCMRDAADWQLKQVINWCSKHVHTASVDALRAAMRPQENL
jgi:hypothetical protein